MKTNGSGRDHARALYRPVSLAVCRWALVRREWTISARLEDDPRNGLRVELTTRARRGAPKPVVIVLIVECLPEAERLARDLPGILDYTTLNALSGAYAPGG